MSWVLPLQGSSVTVCPAAPMQGMKGWMSSQISPKDFSGLLTEAQLLNSAEDTIPQRAADQKMKGFSGF